MPGACLISQTQHPINVEIMTQTFRLKKPFHLRFESKVMGPLSIKKPLKSVTIILEKELGVVGL